MSEDSLLRQTLQGGGCRLCIAPDTECVSIFQTSAADKEPLASKILACVSIKIHQSDRMSGRICHACISYLNSWQSFKNRCYAAQKRQRNHLTMQQSKERSLLIQPIAPTQQQKPLQQQQSNVMNQQQIVDHAAAQQQRHRLLQQQRAHFQQQRILKKALTTSKPTMVVPEQPAVVPSIASVNPFDQFNSSIDVSFIKSEPIDADAEMLQNDDERNNIENEEDIMDPMQFLANEGVDDYGEQESPPILTSLGLTHINHNSEYDNDTTAHDGDLDDSSSMPPPFGHYRPLPPHCIVCKMKFSNRANARRHERNIHGRVIDQSATAAAMLQLSRNHQISITAPMRPAATSSPAAVAFRSTSQPQSVLQRKQKLAAAAKPVFDYTKPQQYRHLITESKLYFIKRHIEFLEQYQHMRCTCCDKDYPTYKLFMAHMRKKYDTLSRNLCFKCLKQFDTKSLFIAHLKKKNCINLYKVYCADDSISKEPLPANFRAGTKDIIANKVYGCKLCEKTFRLKVDFRSHVNVDHVDEQSREQAGNGCAYCDIVFEDSAARKRHFNNLQCIVFLICGTCDDKFDTLALYIEHVYAAHLPQVAAAGAAVVPTDGETTVDPDAETSLKDDATKDDSVSDTSALRNPHNCTVCGKQYNNYYNMLRHMEAKHPDNVPRIYQCDECDTGFPRQSELRDHLSREHGITLPKVVVRRDGFTCRPCGNTFDHKDAMMEHQATSHSKYFCHLCDTETNERDEMDVHLAEHANVRANQCTICEHSFNSERGLETHLAVVHGIKKAQMPRRFVSQGGDGEDSDDPPKKNVQLQANGMKDEPTKEEHEEDNDGDLDEMVEKPSKRIKYDLSASGSGGGADQSATALRKCKLCHETFFGGIALANHMRTHGIMSAGTPRPPLQKASALARLHPRIIPSATIKTKVISRMRCRLCQKRIHTKTSYKRHMLNIHGVRDCVFIKCTVCPAEFSNDKGLKVHMFRTHNITVQQMQQDVRLRPVPKKESTAADAAPERRMFECNICHTVYRSRQQMYAHKATVHGSANASAATVSQSQAAAVEVKLEPASNDEEEEVEQLEEEDPLPTVLLPDQTEFDPNEMWWQCRYCDATFNASKKLTIHMNSHEEYDTRDNSCVDCGNIYRTRKSLWVHRHKKHPRIPNPSPCELCIKVFFDKTELMHHLRTHPNADVFTHLTEMQDSLKEEQLQALRANQREEQSCHICGQSFYDKRVLSKHLRTHEPLEDSEMGGPAEISAKMSSVTNTKAKTGLTAAGREYSFPSYQGQMVDGEYACDMCPKTFPLINALKVHRGWHFRSPDGRQVTDTNNMWQPGQGRGSAAAAAAAANMAPFKRQRSGARVPTCPYCRSTFASGNNLRRHIVEVHKRNESNGHFSDGVSVDKELECQQCDITFSSRAEWVEHKISHARTMKPSKTFEWGCDICGKVFTRKERLLAHIATHATDSKRDSMGQHSEDAGDSKSSMSSYSQDASRLRERLQMPREHPGTADSEGVYGDEYEVDGDEDAGEMDDEEAEQQQMDEGVEEEQEEEEDEEDEGEEQDEGVDDDDEEEEEDVDDRAPHGSFEEVGEENEENDSEAELDQEEVFDEQDEHNSSSGADEPPARAYSCDLCQVFFKTAKDLRRHVTSHFINGPPISTIPAKTTATPPASSITKPSASDRTTQQLVDGFRCRLCGSSSKSHIDMIKCMDNHKVVTNLRCGDCKLYFADAQQVLDHEKLCHPNKFQS